MLTMIFYILPWSIRREYPQKDVERNTSIDIVLCREPLEEKALTQPYKEKKMLSFCHLML